MIRMIVIIRILVNNSKTTTSKPFEYKTKTTGSPQADNSRLDAEAAVPLKYLSNFWRFLGFIFG